MLHRYARVLFDPYGLGYRLLACSQKFAYFTRRLHFLDHHADRRQVEKLLTDSAVEIDFTKYTDSGLLQRACPVRRVYVNQLAANHPIEDRWNIGLAQVEGVISSCLFSVLDGHLGTSCVHTLAWSILDYVAAAFLHTHKLHFALEYWRSHDALQPYHLARRMNLYSSADHRLLGHAATSPSTQLSAYMRRCLHEYVVDLVARVDRNYDPIHCMTEALLRLDDDLCSVNRTNHLELESVPLSAYDLSNLSRDLLRVALSGAVGIVGRIYWHDNDNYPRSNTLSSYADLHIANVGDCGAVLLRQVDPTDKNSEYPSLQAIQCSIPHKGACNLDESRRIAAEHPENRPSELFREGGRLLGELEPSRAFGDVRYKWPVDRLLTLSGVLEVLSTSKRDAPHPPESANTDFTPFPQPYTSPPYLTAMPQVTHFRLTPADRYLILATDGLWDMLSIEQTTWIMEAELRKSTSPATRLLWNCLLSVPPSMARVIARDISSKREVDHKRKLHLAQQEQETDRKANERALKLLSLPPGVARYYRDDITVMVLELFDRSKHASRE